MRAHIVITRTPHHPNLRCPSGQAWAIGAAWKRSGDASARVDDVGVPGFYISRDIDSIPAVY